MTTNLRREQIEEIRDGCEGVTVGNWYRIMGRKYAHVSTDAFKASGYYLRIASNIRPRDAEYVARLDPDTVRALCDEILYLRDFISHRCR